MTVRHLLTHTAGLTLGLAHTNPVDALYRQSGQDVLPLPGATLRQTCADVGALPLLFEPGTAWNYSLGVDVLGRIIEVVGGESLDTFIDPASAGLVVNEELRPTFREPAQFPSGSCVPGLVSTLEDYHRFAAMLVRGGELDGERLDPVDGVTAVFCTQVVTWGTHRTPTRRQLRKLVYQAMT